MESFGSGGIIDFEGNKFSFDSRFDLEIGDFSGKSGNKYSIVWKPNGPGGSIDSDPIVHEGIVYIGAGDWYFYAVNAENGKEIWRFRTSGYVGTMKPFIFNDIYSLSASTVMYTASTEKTEK